MVYNQLIHNYILDQKMLFHPQEHNLKFQFFLF
uniref:Uncharacterized protein n=1 Tax=CrAss-like virus sp. ctYsL76 TaxID=2826826 RepID=A0A8S5QLX3_9CAUD|nr:MAG TPA: hypothetical protein [CrAss-like virus sp. ctYsL76]